MFFINFRKIEIIETKNLDGSKLAVNAQPAGSEELISNLKVPASNDKSNHINISQNFINSTSANISG